MPQYLQLLPRKYILITWPGGQGSLYSWSHWTKVIDVTQKGAHIPVWYPNFCDCFQGTPLYYLALVASGAYGHGSHGTVTNRERLLKQLPPTGHSKRQQTHKLSFSVKEDC